MTDSMSEKAYAKARRSELLTLALAHPEGLTKYAFTKGMQKVDAMHFWEDARDLGFVKLGTNARGTNVFGYRSTIEPATEAEIREAYKGDQTWPKPNAEA